MITLKLSLRSLWNRRGTAALTVLSIALSVSLLLGVDKLRTSARESFTQTVSGTDLIVGARSGPIQLLLYAVFRIGDATNNLSWASYQKISAHRQVAWSIPISLGDSHRGFRVLGTTEAYFEHLRYRQNRALEFAEGRRFSDLYDAVIGADVARELNYRVGQKIVVAHGTAVVNLQQHDDQPFTVVGILKTTGTPVDRTVHVSLQAIEAIHLNWRGGTRLPQGAGVDAKAARDADLTPKTITAFYLGLKSKVATFLIQRGVNEFPEEPLLAIMPAVALNQLWSLLGVAEKALLAIAAFVVLTGLLGMLSAILTSLNERRREMAVLRSVGARPRHIFVLMISEAGALAALGIALGVALNYLLITLAQPLLEARAGIYVTHTLLTTTQWQILGAVLLSALLIGALPAWLAYRRSLSDGLSIRT
jgi:putative ABC transport system permease protein